MARLIDKPIPPPTLNADREPLSFRWAGRVHRVAQVVDCWVDTGAWWDGELEKTFWRVQTVDGGMFDLWQDTRGQWAVYRVWD